MDKIGCDGRTKGKRKKKGKKEEWSGKRSKKEIQEEGKKRENRIRTWHHRRKEREEDLWK